MPSYLSKLVHRKLHASHKPDEQTYGMHQDEAVAWARSQSCHADCEQSEKRKSKGIYIVRYEVEDEAAPPYEEKQGTESVASS